MGVDETQGVALGWNSNAPLGLNGGHGYGLVRPGHDRTPRLWAAL